MVTTSSLSQIRYGPNDLMANLSGHVVEVEAALVECGGQEVLIVH